MQILVAGMHRAGTSMVTRLLNLAGAYAGAEGEFTDTGVSDENAKGFWERRDVREANERLLNSQGCRWDVVSSWDPGRLSAEALERFDRDVRTIALRLDANRPWVVKDPRSCLTLSRWLASLERPLVVLVVRAPMEVALSLRARNDFPLDVGLALWERYMACALDALGSTPVVLTQHDRLISDPVESTRELLTALALHGCAMPRQPDAAGILAFVDPKLYRARAREVDFSSWASHPAMALHRSLIAPYPNVGEGLPLSDVSKASLERHDRVTRRVEARIREDSLKEFRAAALARADEKASVDRATAHEALLHEIRSGIAAVSDEVARVSALATEGRDVTRRIVELHAAFDVAGRSHEVLAGRIAELHRRLDVDRSVEHREATSRDRAHAIALADIAYEIRAVRTELRDSASRVHRAESFLARFRSDLDTLEANFRALLQSARWRLGNGVATLVERLLGRSGGVRSDHSIDIVLRQLRDRLVDPIDGGAAPQLRLEPQPPVGPGSSPRFAPQTQRLEEGARVAPSVDVVVCVHDAIEDVRALVASLLQSSFLPFRVIFVNDGSSRETGRYLREISKANPAWTLLENPVARGFTRAANHGLAQSEADFVVLLNSDTIVTPRWLEALVDCAWSDPRLGLVGPLSNAASWQSVPMVLGHDGQFVTNELPRGWCPATMAARVRDVSMREYPRVELLNGFCLGIRRAVIDAIGLLDEQAFPRGYGEENDYCLRAAKAGFELAVADDAYVFHAKSRSYGGEERIRLSAAGSRSLREKHGEARVAAAVSAARGNEVLARLRARLGVAIRKACLPDWIIDPTRSTELSVLFLLPVQGGGGGAHSVMQEAAAMSGFGIRTCVAVRSASKDQFSGVYADFVDLNSIVHFYREEEQLLDLAAGFSVVVATVFHSVRILERISARHERILPVYYVQDYEPMFFETGSPEWNDARDSYDVPALQVGMAKTDWICRKVIESHALPMQRVMASIDHDVYFPSPRNASRSPTLTLCAMIRPSTPRRAPERTLRVLRTIVEALEEPVEVLLFGVEASHPVWKSSEAGFAKRVRGVLDRKGVAEVLRESDLFLDLSDYQAFGRTGLEAMACGCVAVVPASGGADEYAIDGYNAIVVDAPRETDEQIAARILALLEDRTHIKRMREHGLATASRYSPQIAALSELALFRRQLDLRFAGLPAVKAPLRESTSPKRMRIGLLCQRSGAGDPVASASIRLIRPFNQAAKHVPIDVEVMARVTEEACHFDAVVVQRTCLTEREAIGRLLDLRRTKGLVIGIDFDDRLWELPEEHHQRADYEKRFQQMGKLMGCADFVTASTQELADELSRIHPQVRLVENHLDLEECWLPQIDEPCAPEPAGDVLDILMMGTRTHATDLVSILPALDALWDSHPGRFRLDLVGVSNEAPERPWINVLPPPEGPYEEFVSWIRAQKRWQVGVAPLVDNPFNQAKSRIKILDYWALGLAVVATHTREYGRTISAGTNGLLAASLEEWIQGLTMLLERPAHVAALATEGRRTLREKYALSKNWNRYWSPAAHALGFPVPAPGRNE